MAVSVKDKRIAKSNKREYVSEPNCDTVHSRMNTQAEKRALQERMFPPKQEPFIKRFIRWWKT